MAVGGGHRDPNIGLRTLSTLKKRHSDRMRDISAAPPPVITVEHKKLENTTVVKKQEKKTLAGWATVLLAIGLAVFLGLIVLFFHLTGVEEAMKP